jgi:hypothetical protein
MTIITFIVIGMVLLTVFNLMVYRDFIILQRNNKVLRENQKNIVKKLEAAAITTVQTREDLDAFVGDNSWFSNYESILRDMIGSWTIFRPEDYGAEGDGLTNDTIAIQDAINAASANGGGIVLFKRSCYIFSETLTSNTDNIFLVGAGQSWVTNTAAEVNENASTVQAGGTNLKWVGVNGGTMIRFAPVSGGSRIRGGGIDAIALSGNVSASIGLELLSCSGMTFPRLFIENCTNNQIYMGVSGETLAVGEVYDCQWNHFGQIVLRDWNASTCTGIVMDGSETANTSFNTFDTVFMIYNNSHGIDILNADMNSFNHVVGYRKPGGTGVGVYFRGSAMSTVYARKNTFVNLQAGAGGVTAEADIYSSSDNTILLYSRGNNTPTPTVENDAHLTWNEDTGQLKVWAGDGTRVMQERMINYRMFGNIGHRTFAAQNDAKEIVNYSGMLGAIIDDTKGSEEGRIAFETIVDGSNSYPAFLQRGVNAGTSADGGLGYYNAQHGFKYRGIKVVGSRDPGWSAWTGTATKTTVATESATVKDCAEAIKGITDALIAHGLIGN